MKKIWVASLVVMLLLFTGFSSRLPLPVEGVYPLRMRVLTIFDFQKDLQTGANIAQLTDSKPDELSVDFDYSKLTDCKFGFFKFGNNDKKTWFLMGKDNQGFWSDFYIDQNLDNHITQKEKVQLLSFTDTVRGMNRKGGMTLIPVLLRISYKGTTSEYLKNLYFSLQAAQISKKNKKDETSDTIVLAQTYSFFEGEFKVLVGKEEKNVRFRIIDNNGNGCFNDYGKDLLYIDLKGDGIFKKSEMQEMVEFFDSMGPAKVKKQLHFIVAPCPARIAVIEASKEFDRSQLEPQSDQPIFPEPRKDNEANPLR